MAEAKTKKFEFRGKTFEVCLPAARSVRVQRDIQLMGDPARAARGWGSYDALFCGRLDEYLGEIPSEDGTVGEFGCTDEDFVAFVRAAAEAASTKN